MLRATALLVIFAACARPRPAPTPPPTPVAVAPTAPPVPPAAPAWPVPVRVLRWGERGLELVGELPGLAALPDEPWMAEPITWPADSATWSALLDELRVHDVPGLALRERPIRPEVLAQLGELPALRYLDLSGASLDAAAIGRLANRDALVGLYLARTGLDDATLAAVIDRHPGLEVLDLDDTGAGDLAATAAGTLPRLRTITLADTAVTDRGGIALARATALGVVDLSRTRVGAGTARALAERPLTELYLARTDVHGAAWDLAPINDTIVRLDLSDQDVDDEAIGWIELAEHLVEANLGGTRVGDPTVRRLAALPLLREVDLAETRLTAAGARALAARVTLQRVDVAATRVDDRAAAALLALPDLLVLRLDDTAITDRALAAPPPKPVPAAALTPPEPGRLILAELYLARTKVGDAGLAILDRADLTALGIRKTRITDATVARITRQTSLRTLDVGETQLSADALTALAPLRALERLYLDGTRSGDPTFAALAGARLRVLHAGGTMLSDASLDVLAAMPLEELSVPETLLTAAITERLDAWPRLAVLALNDLPIRDEHAARLVSARRLRVLDLSATEVDDPSPLAGLARLEVVGLSQRMIGTSGVRALASLPRLRQLALSQCGLGPDVLPVLAGIRTLRKLDLRGNPVTLGQARRALPGVDLD